MREYIELKTNKLIEGVFGVRRHITFRCGKCMCAFARDMCSIRFYESTDTWCNHHVYLLKTECPLCHKPISVLADEELAINPRYSYDD